jgi:hypothetical protein
MVFREVLTAEVLSMRVGFLSKKGRSGSRQTSGLERSAVGKKLVTPQTPNRYKS